MVSTQTPPLELGLGTKELICARVSEALRRAFAELGDEAPDPMVSATSRPEFGDYQCNVAMALAKRLKMKPREVADKLLASLQMEDLVARTEIAGPGFINLHLSDAYTRSKLRAMSMDTQRLGVTRTSKPQRVVVDFSSPNIAKEMHVGHLRSTIIGDSLAKILSFLGHDVLRLNHVGDWGTQFGMLIHYLRELQGGDTVDANIKIGDLVTFYKAAKKRFDEDPAFQELSRKEVVKLQGGDEASLSAWRLICGVSRAEFEKIYHLLAVDVEERGESFYNPYLSSVVTDLREKALLTESDGAQCVFLPGYVNADGKSALPLIVQKTDGGFLYATTDLAAIRHRTREERADRLIYVTDIGQAQHFQMVFDAARAVGYADALVQLTHVPFGLVQGEDGKKFKSRSGDTVKLKDLLDEAVRLAGEEISKRQGEGEADGGAEASAEGGQATLSEEQRALAKVVGLGAVKYADLSMNRESNYRFSYKKMLSLQGNTAPYMLYAYVRIKGIQRRAAESLSAEAAGGEVKGPYSIELVSPEEVALGKHIMRFDEVLREIEQDLYPNKVQNTQSCLSPITVLSCYVLSCASICSSCHRSSTSSTSSVPCSRPKRSS